MNMPEAVMSRSTTTIQARESGFGSAPGQAAATTVGVRNAVATGRRLDVALTGRHDRYNGCDPSSPEVGPVTFDPNARLDTSEVTDARGGGGLGGRGGLAVGGGGIGLVIAIVYLLLGGDPSVLLNGDTGAGTGADTNGPASSALAQCRT